MTSFLKEEFAQMFEDIEQAVPYSSEWENGTGYFDHAVRLIDLPAGVRAKSVDEDDRRIIFVGTAVGTVVIFERYNPSSDRYIVASNVPQSLRFVIPSGPIDADTLVRVVGYSRTNIGSWLADLLNEVNA